MGFKGLGYFLITLCFFINNATAQRIETNFNNNWHFILKDDAAFSSEHFDDSTWEMLNVPHDWSFEKGVRMVATKAGRRLPRWWYRLVS